MINPPSGEITFLFTDIEGSTRIAQEFPDSLQPSLEIHNKLLQQAIESNNGYIFEINGDAYFASFANAKDAIKAAYDSQIYLANEKWDNAVIKVRMGIHSGKAEWNGSCYLGYITLATASRVASTAYGGQILISEDTIKQLSKNENNKITFRDLGERRLKDLKQPLRLFQLISDVLKSDFPPLVTLDARQNNLPVQLTSFIGRKEEIEKVKDLLKTTHLLSLTGPGGAGKTRLSLQVGNDVIDDFNNGVWFIELAPINDPLMIPQEILKELGIKEESKKTLEETLVSYLKDKKTLLILDNCEHLIEACAVLTEDLLKTCPGLKIIATSREALKCTGEQTHSVLSLKVPDPANNISSEQLYQIESIRLFIERAMAVDPNFKVDNENAGIIAGICSRLDGIPLAIELAAARIKVLSLKKILEKLNDRFSLLTGGNRTALPRQQTLKALIDWSYELMSDTEKKIWSRLSVFNDGWTLEAAEIICSDEKVNNDDMLNILEQLTEKSVLIYDAITERYNMLETLKHYTSNKLNESSEKHDLPYKHLQYYLELTEKYEDKLNGNDAQIWLDKLEIEDGNFKSAIECSLKQEYFDEGLRLAGSLALFWDIRGLYFTGRKLLENLIANKSNASKSVVGKAMNRTGILAKNQGDYKNALQYFEDSLAIYSELNNKLEIAASLRFMGAVVYEQGNYDKARKIFEEDLKITREIGDKMSIASTLNNLGNILYDQGDYKLASQYQEESLTINKEIGNKRMMSSSLNNLGNIAYNVGEYEKAQKLYEESFLLKRELGDKKGIAISLHNFGLLFSIKGNYKQAKIYFEDSLAIEKEIGDKHGIADTLYNLGNIEFRNNEIESALNIFKESLKYYQDVGSKLGIVYCIMGFAAVTCAKNDYPRAAKMIGFVDTSMKAMNTVFSKDDYEQYNEIYNILNNKLSNEDLIKYRKESEKLTYEQAVEIALG